MENEMMNPTPSEKSSPADQSVVQDSTGASAASQPENEADLSDSIKQEKYRKEYLRQIRLRSCPGCGDDDIV